MLTVDEYLTQASPSQRAELERIRAFVKQLVPDAEETISYGLPALKYKGKPLVYFGAFKNHMSLFPTAGPTETLKDKLSGYFVSKGTIQFTEDNPLPDSLLEEIILERLDTIQKSSK